jgi:hypothetical protein
MPNDSQTAKTLLDADYAMKLVCEGYGTVKIKNPFQDPYHAQLEARKSAIMNDPSLNFAGAARMWFTPGRMSYVRDENSIFIDCVQIVLKSEDYLRGGVVDYNPFNQMFTCAWSNRMDEVIRSEPIWRKMQDIVGRQHLSDRMS